MNPLQWSRTERMLIEVLTSKVAMLRESDARTMWRAHAVGKLKYDAAVARLTHAGLIERYLVNLHPPLMPKRPVVQFAADDELAFGIVHEQTARRLRERWSRPAQPTKVLVASRRASNLFGSSAGRLPDLAHRNHDALLGEVYVRYQIEAPRLAGQWVGEHVLPKAGFRIKDPDAFLFRDEGPYRIVESGGSYNARQLVSLVEYASDRGLELEVW